MSRLLDTFSGLKQRGQTGFIAYITAGDPNLETTRELVLELDRCGVDIVELGVPFSDPIADGLVNQVSAQRALKNQVSLSDILDLVEGIRLETEIPLVLFSYYNPIHCYGLERFVDQAANVGVDGALMTDLPPEEGQDYKRLMDEKGLDTIFLLAPTSRDSRIRLISSYSTGFVYYISRTGVTGERDRLADSVQPMVEKIRTYTCKPIAVGFGISAPEHVIEISRYADAVVVGSAIVRRIGEGEKDPDLVSQIGAFVKTLVRPMKGKSNGYR